MPHLRRGCRFDPAACQRERGSFSNSLTLPPEPTPGIEPGTCGLQNRARGCNRMHRAAFAPQHGTRKGQASKLMRFAFGGKKPPLLLSSDASEQRGAMEMYAGLMSYYRNPAAHRIRDDLDKQEVMRIVSWIDHL